MSDDTMTRLSAENDGSVLAVDPMDTLTFLFPEKRSLTHYYIAVYPTSFNNLNAGTLLFQTRVEISTNASTPTDGTWTTVVANYGAAATTTGDATGWRRGKRVFAAANLNAIRISPALDRQFYNSQGDPTIGWIATHFYGVSTGTATQRVELWQPTSNARTSPGHFDFGDHRQGSSADIQFRVKNFSMTAAAQNVVVSAETDVAALPYLPYQLLFAQQGSSTFAATQTLAAIPPNGLSGVLTLRRNTVSDAALGPWAFRVKATPTSWA
jgi:hypothetical protein